MGVNQVAVDPREPPPVQVTPPSELYAELVVPGATAIRTLLRGSHPTHCQATLAGIVDPVHVVPPSVEYAAEVVVPVFTVTSA